MKIKTISLVFVAVGFCSPAEEANQQLSAQAVIEVRENDRYHCLPPASQQ